MKVNIYLETDKQSQECMQRKYGYVIETIYKGTPITREGFGNIEGTYHKTNLQAFIKALGHFRKECEVCVYTRDAFVANILADWETYIFSMATGGNEET